MSTKPANLLESIMNERSARRTAERIIEEEKAQKQQAMDDRPQLRQIDRKDQAGRTITTFEGRATWLREMGPEPRRLIGINTRG
jgi:hypothetical protein